MPPVVSIIIPTLNEEFSIRQTLDALRNFDENIEVIVVDGGSDDATLVIAENYNVKILRVQRGRVMTASGRGIRNVYITLTDATGNNRLAVSTTFGYYRFNDVAAGETYILSAIGKRYTFSQPAQVLNINEATDAVNFIADSK